MAQLSLSLFGPFRAALDGVPVTQFESDKVRALLAYLAVEAHRAHPRDALATLLWPLRPNRNALSNLRYALYNLRNAIGDRKAEPPFLLITRHAVQFNAVSDHFLDVAEFRNQVNGPGLSAKLREKKRGWVDEEECHRLECAVALYQGVFLDGFSVAGSPDFEEWAFLQREQLNREVGSALHQLAAAYEKREAYAAAVRCLRLQLELEPWDERAHRGLMRLLAKTDRQGAALRQYEACCRLLMHELGIGPAVKTRKLYERIQRGRPGPSTAKAPASGLSISPSPTPPSAIVGRDSELSKLETVLDTALAGQGGVAFVVGEAGSGKTTLMQAFAQQAMETHRDLVTASGSCCHHAGIGDAYLPFREILQSLTGNVEPRRAAGSLSRDEADRLWSLFPEATRALIDEGPALIDRLVPGKALWERVEAFYPARTAWKARLRGLVQQRSGNTGSPLPQPLDLFEQVTSVLRAISHHRPLILIIDDLQFADPASVSMLFHVGRHLAGSRILILGAHRPVPSSWRPDKQQHPLPLAAYELRRLFGDVRVDLDESDGRAFIEAFLDTEANRLDDKFRERLERHTGGNPLFTVELLRGLQERGDLVQDTSGHWTVGSSLNWEHLPPRAEAIVAEHLDQLPSRARAVLRIASVEGQTFTAEVAARALDVSLSTVRECLDGPLCTEHRLVQPHSLVWIRPQQESAPLPAQTLSRYRFRHGLFQRYLCGSLNEIERPRLHGSVAEALEASYQQAEAGTATSAAQLAWHFEAAGLFDKATEYLFLAGTEAMDLSAHREAIQCFTHALDLLRELPPSPERTELELELQVALGAPLLATRGWGATERVQVSKRAYDLGQQVGAASHHTMNAMFLLADLSRAQGDYLTSLELGEQMLHLAQQDQNRRHMALAHSTLGETYFFRGAFNKAHHHLTKALTYHHGQEHRNLTLVTGPNLGVMCLVWESWVAWFLGQPDQALCRGREAISLARQIEHPFSLAFALALGGAGLHFLRREHDVARGPIMELNCVVSRYDLPTMAVWASILQGWDRTFEGHGEDGLARIRRGMATWREMGAATGTSFQTLLLVEACQRTGRTEEGLVELERGLDLIDGIQERCFRAEMHRLRGELLLEKADSTAQTTEEATRWIESALDIARELGASASELRAAISLARLRQREGRRPLSRQLLEKAYAKFEEGSDAPDLREAEALLKDLYNS